MDNTIIEFNYKKRQSLTKEEKLYNYASGLIMLTIGVIGILKGFSYQGIYFAYLFIGLIPLINNFWGKERYLTKHSIKVNDIRIVIESNRFNKVVIDFKSVELISILTSGLKVAFVDVVRFIDLSWLEDDQSQILKAKLTELSKLHSFKLY
jgi:hypothetical protein